MCIIFTIGISLDIALKKYKQYSPLFYLIEPFTVKLKSPTYLYMYFTTIYVHTCTCRCFLHILVISESFAYRVPIDHIVLIHTHYTCTWFSVHVYFELLQLVAAGSHYVYVVYPFHYNSINNKAIAFELYIACTYICTMYNYFIQ